MARKSPRSRRKRSETPRLPGSSRARATPRKKRTGTRAASRAASPGGAGASHGPRPAGAARPTRRVPATRRAKVAAKRVPAPRRKARSTRAFQPPDAERVSHVLEILRGLYPDAKCALDFENPLQLLIATILSAQCTDVRVNMVTPALFARYPDAAAFAAADPAELEAMIRSTGFFRNKARAIRECCGDIVTKHGGQVPSTLEALTALRGVGRKTANVVLGNAFGVPGLVVDTHVTRLANRLGLTRESDAVKIEFALMSIVPRERWTMFSHWLILHGRAVCNARKPHCSVCALLPHCPRIGVTASD